MDGVLTLQEASPDEALCWIESTLTDRITRSLGTYHLFHSGAVARNGKGVLLPGASGAGKSTTVAALTLGGFDYCSDEVAVVGEDRRLRPFPRAIALKSGGWRRIVADLPASALPQLITGTVETGIWYLRSKRSTESERSLAGHPIELIVLLEGPSGGRSPLRRIPRSLAAARLVEQSFNLSLWKEQGFNLIMDLVEQADCFSLNTTDLPRAVAALRALTV